MAAPPCRGALLLAALLAAPCWGLRARRAELGEEAQLRHRPMRQSTQTSEAWRTSYYGHPYYYEGYIPPDYYNWTADRKQDFYSRVERWHLSVQGEKGACHSPRPGEKVIYFIQHGFNSGNGIQQVGHTAERDPKLDYAGYIQSLNLVHDPVLKKAFSGDPKYQPQAVIISPARKAMQTAIVGFGQALPNATWDLNDDITGSGLEGIHGKLHPEIGSAYLRELNETSLLEKYNHLPADWQNSIVDHKKKFEHFKKHLLKRPEERMIVVTHNQVVRLAGFNKVLFGEVHVAALEPSGKLRGLSPPSCWP